MVLCRQNIGLVSKFQKKNVRFYDEHLPKRKTVIQKLNKNRQLQSTNSKQTTLIKNETIFTIFNGKNIKAPVDDKKTVKIDWKSVVIGWFTWNGAQISTLKQINFLRFQKKSINISL